MEKPIHYAPNYFMRLTHPLTISLIGCGGTGSLIATRLARMDQALRQLEHPGIHLTVYDGDVIETHNIGRQNFMPGDVGQYKANCLIEKINFAYGLQWDAVNQYVDNVPLANIIITAVDNAGYRMKLDKTIKQGLAFNPADYLKAWYWLDAGNGKDFGQVILSTINVDKDERKSRYKVINELPSVVDIFGNLKKHDSKKKQGIAGCSIAESLQEQDLFINDAISVQAVNLLWKLIREYNISYHGVIINQATLQQRGIAIK